jgi:hypothetical protein
MLGELVVVVDDPNHNRFAGSGGLSLGRLRAAFSFECYARDQGGGKRRAVTFITPDTAIQPWLRGWQIAVRPTSLTL